MSQAEVKRRRWNVITSGLLVGALALVVTFTSRAAFFSPMAVVVIAAVGVMALLLQLRFRYPQRAKDVPLSGWLNVAGVVLAVTAFLADLLRIRAAVAEAMAIAAVVCFGTSGAIVLRGLRNRQSAGK